MTTLGPISERIFRSMKDEMNKPDTRDMIIKNVIEPIIKDIAYKYYPYIATVIMTLLIIVILLVIILIINLGFQIILPVKLLLIRLSIKRMFLILMLLHQGQFLQILLSF